MSKLAVDRPPSPLGIGMVSVGACTTTTRSSTRPSKVRTSGDPQPGSTDVAPATTISAATCRCPLRVEQEDTATPDTTKANSSRDE